MYSRHRVALGEGSQRSEHGERGEDRVGVRSIVEVASDGRWQNGGSVISKDTASAIVWFAFGASVCGVALVVLDMYLGGRL